MAAESDIETGVLQQGCPKFGARLILVTVSPQWDVAQEDTTLCFPEFTRFHFLLQEVALLLTEGREIVESIINRMVVGLILSAIKDYETGVTPTECSIGLATGLFQQGRQSR